MAQVDSLELVVESEAKGAVDALDTLIAKLDVVAKGISAIGNAKGFKDLNNAMGATSKTMSEVQSGLSSVSQKISKPVKDISDAFSQISKEVQEINKDLGKGFLVGGDTKDIERGIKNYTNSLEKAKLKVKDLELNGNPDEKYANAVKEVVKLSNVLESLQEQLESVKQASETIPEPNIASENTARTLDDIVDEMDSYLLAIRKGQGYKPFAALEHSLEELSQRFPQATEEIEFFKNEIKDINLGKVEAPKIDTRDWDENTKEVEEKITELQEKFRNVGLDFQFDGSTGELIKAIDVQRAYIDKLYEKEQKAISLGNVKTKGFASLEYDIAKASNELDVMLELLKKANSTEVSPNVNLLSEENLKTLETFEKEFERYKDIVESGGVKDEDGYAVMPYKGIEIALEKLKESFPEAIDLIQKFENLINSIDRNYENAWHGIEMPDSLKIQDDVISNKGLESIQNVTKEVKSIGKAMKLAEIDTQEFEAVLNSLKVPETNETSLTKLQSKLRSTEEQTEKLKYELEKGLEFGTINIDDNTFRKLTIKIRESELTAESLKKRIDEISGEASKSAAEAASAFESKLGNLKIPEIRTNSLKQLERDFKKAEADLDKLRTNLENDITMGRITANFEDTGYQKAMEAITKAEMKVSAIKEKMKTANDTAGQTKGYDNLKAVMGSISSIGNKLSARLKSLTSSIRKFASSALKSFNNGIKTLNDRLSKMSKSIAEAIKTNNKMSFSMKDAVKTVLKYAFGIRSLFVLMNKLRSAAGEGFGNLVQYSSDVNHSVSIMVSALLSLKNAFAVAFAPIVNVVAPYITKFIDMMTRAANVVGQFFSALTGKKIATQATKVYKDYAASLGGVADAAKEADKAMHTLGIDELNIINEDKDTSNGGVDIGDMFTEVPIENDIADWAKRIRDAFNAQDWEQLGKEIAELVNAGLRKIYDFITDITPKVEQALKNFAKVFNSFVEYLDWDLLGRTIGAGVNLITKSINALLGDEGIDFENLGRKISVGFRGMIDEIEWTELGNAIGNWFMVAWRIADGFIQQMWEVSAVTMKNGWEELGIAVGEAVNGVFDRIKFDQIARVVTEGFRGILEAAANALNEIRFDDIAENINRGLDVMAANLSWEHIGEQVTKFSAAIVTAFNDLMKIDFGTIGTVIGEGITIIVRWFNQLTGDNGINFEQLGANISNGLRNLVTNIPWQELGNALGNGFMIGWRILDGFVTDMAQKNDAGLTGWAQLGISLANAVNGIFEKIDFAKIADILARGFNGLVEIIINWTTNIRWEDIANNISNGIMTFINGVKWKEAGETLSNFLVKLFGLFQKVARDTDWKSVGQSIDDFLSSIEWGKIFGKVFETITTILGGLIDGLKETIVGKVGIAVGAGVTAFKAFEAIEPIVTAIFGTKGKIYTGIITGLAGLVTAIAIGGKDLAKAANDLIHNILDWLIEAVDNTDWGEVWRNIIEFLGNIDWFGITGKILELGIKLVGHIVSGLIEGILTTNWLEIGANLIDGFIKGVADCIEALFEIPKMIFDAIVNGIKNLFGIHSPSTVMAEIGGFLMQGLIEGISSFVDAVIETFFDIGKKIVEVWEDIKKTFQEKWQEIVNWWNNSAIVTWWNDSVKPWFTKEKWSDLYDTIKTSLKSKWDETVGEWVSGLQDWWNSHVAPWFTKEKWMDIYNTIKTALKDKWDETVGEWASGIREWWDTHVAVWFTKEKWLDLYETIKTSLKSKWDETVGAWKIGIQNWWSEHVAPWFTKQKWMDVYNSIKTSLKEKWNETVGEWASGIKNWWNEHVASWFTKQKWLELYDTIKSQLQEKWEEVVNWWNNLGIVKWYNEHVKPWFSKDKWSFDGIKEGLSEAWDAAIRAMKEKWNTFAGWMNDFLTFEIPSFNVFGKQFGGMTIDLGVIPTFANGGFPEDGLFMANHTELVGQFSNGRTAVANNEQIIAGIEEAAYRGFMRAQSENTRQEVLLEELIQAVREGKRISIDGREIVTAYDTTKSRMGQRMNLSPTPT